MQKAYIAALYEIAQKDRNVVSLLSDSGTEYDELFYRDMPDQCFNFGISEEHLVSAAAGMAACGKIPFIYTSGAFLAYRAYEFIRDDVCFQKKNVKIVGMGSGLAWSTLGPTHHTTEDISALRALPNLTILSPASPMEVRKTVLAAYELDGPVYIRTGMSREKEIYGEEYSFAVGRNVQLTDGGDITVFSTGSVVSEVLAAAAALAERGIGARVVNVHSIKPFDMENVLQAARETKYIFSVEEHNIMGGLGSAIAETLAEASADVFFTRIGLPDCFAKGYGTLADVRRMNGLDGEGIAAAIWQALCKRGMA